jgi:hypothetical protein
MELNAKHRVHENWQQQNKEKIKETQQKVKMHYDVFY